MKGLILAGGVGSRLRPFTYGGPKQLFPIANRPVLVYALDALVEAGIRDIAVLVSPESRAEIAAAIGDGAGHGAGVSYIVQDRPAGLAHAVQTARAFVGDDDVCVYLGDNLLGAGVGEMVRAFAASPVDAAVLLKEVDNPSRFGVAVVGPDGTVTGLVEKPENPPSKLALVGVYLLRPRIFEAIARIRPSPRGELEITDALMELLAIGGKVSFNLLDAWWVDTGKMDDLLRANDAVLAGIGASLLAGAVVNTVVDGVVRIEAGATVIDSELRGPVVIGAGATLRGASVGPNVSVGPGATVSNASVRRSILLEGSQVFDVVLQDSLLGRRVVVRAGETPSLWVGDDCAVSLPRRT